jgi:hypothetical protein
MKTLIHICGNCDQTFTNAASVTMHQRKSKKGCTNQDVRAIWTTEKQQSSNIFQDLDTEEESWRRVMTEPESDHDVVSDDNTQCSDTESECLEEGDVASINVNNCDDGSPNQPVMQDVFQNTVSMQLGFYIHDNELSTRESKRLISIFEDAGVDISFKSKDALKKRLAEASIGLGLPQFTCEDLKVPNDDSYFNGPILMAYRNVVDLVKCRFSERRPRSDFVVSAMMGGFYSEIHSGKWWKETEKKVKQEHGEDVNLLVTYMYSDETQVTSFGSATAYPLHVSIANFIGDGKKENSQILLAYLPVPKSYKAAKKSTYVKQRANAIRQEALQRILAPLYEAGETPEDIVCPDGITR